MGFVLAILKSRGERQSMFLIRIRKDLEKNSKFIPSFLNSVQHTREVKIMMSNECLCHRCKNLINHQIGNDASVGHLL